jgi:hypothetical protein
MSTLWAHAERTQESDKNLSSFRQGGCCKLVLSAIATDPSEGIFSGSGTASTRYRPDKEPEL